MEEIYATVLIVSIILLMLSAGIVFAIIQYNSKQAAFRKEKKDMQAEFLSQLMQSQIEVQEATLSALGKELHDNIGQILSSTRLLLGITHRGGQASTETLELAEESLGKAIDELRSLSKSLDKEWLEQFDLVTNLETEVCRINAAQAFVVEFRYSGKLQSSPQEQIILFRIIQEALHNSIKHSGSRHILITIYTGLKETELSVSDDGNGFSEVSAPPGLGIRNMKHRASLLGGSIRFESSSAGSSVYITIPSRESSHEN